MINSADLCYFWECGSKNNKLSKFSYLPFSFCSSKSLPISSSLPFLSRSCCRMRLCSWLHFFWRFLRFISSKNFSGIWCRVLMRAMVTLALKMVSVSLELELSRYLWCRVSLEFLFLECSSMSLSSSNFSRNSSTMLPPFMKNSQSIRSFLLKINCPNFFPSVICQSEVICLELEINIFDFY